MISLDPERLHLPETLRLLLGFCSDLFMLALGVTCGRHRGDGGVALMLDRCMRSRLSSDVVLSMNLWCKQGEKSSGVLLSLRRMISIWAS